MDMVFDGEEMEMDFMNEETPKRRAGKKATRKEVTVREKAVFTTKEAATLSKLAIAKIKDIKTELSERVYERETVIDDIFRALVAGENILLLGPPGTGKTMLAELFGGHVTDSFMFKWLMNRTTDPADIIGPYSVKSMEKDKFRRILKGRAADAEFFFADEIFKSNEPALNFMLSMLNEGYIYNDGKQHSVPLRMAIAASNEYPENDDLEAFYDRFIFRHWIGYINEPSKRIEMARAGRDSKVKAKNLVPPTQITLDEIDALQQYVYQVKIPAAIEKNYDRLVRTLSQNGIKISDRRYYKGQVAMMANALLEGRVIVNGNDFRCLLNIMWNKDVKELELVERELDKFANPHESLLKELLKKAEEVKTNTLKIENRTERAGEAVQANTSLQDILGKMEDEIDNASTNGVDIKPFKTFVKKVEEIMDHIAEECLKNTSRATRDW